VRVALDNASAHLAAGFEREVRAATGVRALRTPAEQSLVEQAGAREVAGVQLEVNHSIGGRPAHLYAL
jgi:urease beta subunit